MRILLLFIFTFLFSIQAQNSDSLKSYNLKQITVQSSLVLQPKSTIKINERTIALSDAVTLDKIAPLLPSTKVQTNSRGETLFYLRNSGKRRLSLLIDGIPLNIPWDNRIDLSLIPTTAISKIMITKGIPSVIYGPNSLGGVINISTPEADESSNRGELRLSVGENGLKSLDGCPHTVEHDFTCGGNLMASLKYLPQVINGTIKLFNNINLTDFTSDLKSCNNLIKTSNRIPGLTFLSYEDEIYSYDSLEYIEWNKQVDNFLNNDDSFLVDDEEQGIFL